GRVQARQDLGSSSFSGIVSGEAVSVHPDEPAVSRLYRTPTAAVLFVRHLEDLRHRLRRDPKSHLLCDHAKPHDFAAGTRDVAEHGDRVVVHYLPKRAPECNPIERVWWHLHDEITRNHSCKSMQELRELVLGWLRERSPFTVEGSAYPRPTAA